MRSGKGRECVVAIFLQRTLECGRPAEAARAIALENRRRPLRAGSPPNRAKRAGFRRLRRYLRASSGPGRRESPPSFRDGRRQSVSSIQSAHSGRSSRRSQSSTGGRAAPAMADETGPSRTIPDHSGPSRTGKAAGKGSGGAPGTGQAVGKTRVHETSTGPGEVEQGGRGRLPTRCREPPRAIEANGRDDRRSMTHPFPLAPTIRPRAARKADHGPKQGNRIRESVFAPPPDPGCAGVPPASREARKGRAGGTPAHPGSSKIPVRREERRRRPRRAGRLSPAYSGRYGSEWAESRFEKGGDADGRCRSGFPPCCGSS